MYSNRNIATIALLTTLIAGIHFWLLSSNFYERKAVKLITHISKSHRPTIAALWAKSAIGEQIQNIPQSEPAGKQSSNSEFQNQGVKRVTPKNPFLFKNGLSNEDPESQFHFSQRLKETTLKHEQLIHSASAETALRDLKDILFSPAKNQGAEKNCCQVVSNSHEANCSSIELTMRYQNIFDSLRSRLNELTREGIKEFCE